MCVCEGEKEKVNERERTDELNKRKYSDRPTPQAKELHGALTEQVPDQLERGL